jgi:hypothetical protein
MYYGGKLLFHYTALELGRVSGNKERNMGEIMKRFTIDWIYGVLFGRRWRLKMQ